MKNEELIFGGMVLLAGIGYLFFNRSSSSGQTVNNFPPLEPAQSASTVSQEPYNADSLPLVNPQSNLQPVNLQPPVQSGIVPLYLTYNQPPTTDATKYAARRKQMQEQQQPAQQNSGCCDPCKRNNGQSTVSPTEQVANLITSGVTPYLIQQRTAPTNSFGFLTYNAPSSNYGGY